MAYSVRRRSRFWGWRAVWSHWPGKKGESLSSNFFLPSLPLLSSLPVPSYLPTTIPCPLISSLGVNLEGVTVGLTPYSCPVTNTCAAAAVALAPQRAIPRSRPLPKHVQKTPCESFQAGRGCSGLLPSFCSASLLLGVTSAGTLQCRAAGSSPYPPASSPAVRPSFPLGFQVS